MVYLAENECLNTYTNTHIQGGSKSKPLLIYQQIASHIRKALLFYMNTNSGTTASYIKLFALLLVLNILWLSVADTRMRRSSTYIERYTHSN